MDGIFRVDITPIHKAVRELLCNCLSNADYNGTRGLVIKQYNDKLEFSNPGSFLIPKEIAFNGGNSDARNKLILTMFNNINVGERTGSGIPLIFNATKEQGYSTPTFQDFFNPDYTIVTIYLNNINIKPEVTFKKPEVTFIKPEVTFKKPEVIEHSLNNINNNLDIEFLINNLIIRFDIKKRLLEIYHKLGNNIISKSIISEALQIGHNSAGTCIKVLLENNLIEPIKGKGKGKYKFKS